MSPILMTKKWRLIGWTKITHLLCPPHHTHPHDHTRRGKKKDYEHQQPNTVAISKKSNSSSEHLIRTLQIKNVRTLGKYSVTIIIGVLCVTAPRNWTTFGCRIFWSNSSSSLKAVLHKIIAFKKDKSKTTTKSSKPKVKVNINCHHTDNSHFILISSHFLPKPFDRNFCSLPKCYTKGPLGHVSVVI